MKVARIVAAVLAIAAAGVTTARAELLCSQFDGHGRCLVCVWSFYAFSLRPGEPKQPFTCADMAHDPRVTFKFGGTASSGGPEVGLKISGNGYSYRYTWRSRGDSIPIGPATLSFGATADHATVSPTFELTRCGSRGDGAGECHFVISGKLCVTGLC